MLLQGMGAAASGVISGGIKKGASYALKNPSYVIGGLNAVSSVNQNISEGRSVPASLLKSGVEGLLYAKNPVMMGVIGAAPLAVQGVQAAHQFRRTKAEQFLYTENQSQRVGQGYADTAQAQTMRQAALQQIQGNKLNARSALGGEARIFSNRRYTG